jgi:1-acyl-sn-glycerol-3-phosphate acyltransferase
VEDELKTAVATLVQDAFRSLTATLFYLGASVTHDVVIHGREHVSGCHPTIFLCNHKRDLDSLVMVCVAYFARGIARPDRRMVFALREDAFWPTFLRRYRRWPGPLRRMLEHLNVKPHLGFLKAYPMGYVTNRRDVPRIEGQLRTFAELLDRGRDVYWTPEGGLTLDGRLERFRAGYDRIVRTSRAELRMCPAAIFYDFMTTLRTRCFIRLGPEVAIDRTMAKRDLEQQARVAILRQMTINAGHLAAAVLRELPRGAAIDRAELERLLLDRARHYRGLGLALDGRLTMGWTFRVRIGQLLRYARREGILAKEGARWRVDRGLEHPEMRYVLNELAEVEAALGL